MHLLNEIKMLFNHTLQYFFNFLFCSIKNINWSINIYTYFDGLKQKETTPLKNKRTSKTTKLKTLSINRFRHD